MEKEVKRYLNEVKLIIPLNIKEKKEFINILKERILASKIKDYNALVGNFGNPSEIATSFIENMDTETLIQKLKKKKYIHWLFIIIVICIISVSLLEMWRLNQLYDEVRQHQPVQVETTIE